VLESKFEGSRRRGVSSRGVFLLVLLTLFEPRNDVPVFQNPWFVGHMILIASAFACFGVAFCTAMAYLANDWFLKHKLVDRLPLLPPLHVSDRATLVAVAIGFPLLTLGLGVGVAFMISTGTQPDTTVALASLIWLTYAGYLFSHNVGRLRGLRVQVLPVVGFALVLLTLFFARHAETTLQSLQH